jgi:hypothetical protein
MRLVLVLWFGLSGQVAAQADTLHIRFIGNAAFSLSDGSTTLLTDFPYRSGAFGYMNYTLEDPRPSSDAVSVITHHHADHFDASLATAHGWAVIGPADVVSQVSVAQRRGGRGVTEVGAFRVEALQTPHVPEHFSYVVSWRGRRLYFTGDTEDPSSLLATPDLDIAFVTPWLLCTITRAGGDVPAELVVLHHQGPSETPRGCGTPRVLEQGGSFSVISKR